MPECENYQDTFVCRSCNINNITDEEKRTDSKNKDVIIMNLQLKLQLEYMKNKIYTNIIQTQTNIKIEDIIKETENEIHIFNFDKGEIPVVVHNFISDKNEQYIIGIENTIVGYNSIKNITECIYIITNKKSIT